MVAAVAAVAGIAVAAGATGAGVAVAASAVAVAGVAVVAGATGAVAGVAVAAESVTGAAGVAVAVVGAAPSSASSAPEVMNRCQIRALGCMAVWRTASHSLLLRSSRAASCVSKHVLGLYVRGCERPKKEQAENGT